MTANQHTDTAAPSRSAQNLYTPRGLRGYIGHPDHLAWAILVFLGGLWLGQPWTLAQGLAAVAIGSVLLALVQNRTGRARYGESWDYYRRAVPCWWPRWKPWHPTQDLSMAVPARVYFAETCLTCSATARWVRAQNPVGLEIHAAEDHPRETLSRMSYDPFPAGGNGAAEERGLVGFGRVLEHLNFFYALVGLGLRLPLLNHLWQAIADALGAGPRVIPRRGEMPSQQ